MSNIKIVVNKRTVDLYPDAKIRLRFNHPAFSSELQVGSYSLPSNAPKTRNNQQIFAFPEQISNRAYHYKPYQCQVFLNGIYFFEGLLYLNSISRNEYNFDLAVDVGEFSNLIGKYQLNSDVLEHDTYTLPRSSTGVEIRSLFIANEYFGDKEIYKTEIELCKTNALGNVILQEYGYVEYTGDIPETLQNLATFYPLFGTTYAVGAAGQSINVSNVPSNEGMAVKIRKTKIDDNTVTTTQLQLATRTLYPIEAELSYDDFAFATYINPNFYGEANPNFGQAAFSPNFVNAWQPFSTEGKILNNTVKNSYSLVPFMKVRYLINKIGEFTKYKFSGTFLDSLFESGNLILYNNHPLDKIDPFTAGLNYFDEEIKYQNHFPSTQISTFLIELAKMFAMYYSFHFKKNECEIIYKRDLLKAAIVDWSKKATVDYEHTVEYPKKITMKYADSLDIRNDGSYYVVHPIDGLTIGQFPDEEKYELQLGTLQGVDGYTIPYHNQRANSEMFGLKTECDLRIMRFTINILLSLNCNADATRFEWKGENGLYENYHRTWINAIQNGKPYKRKVVLNINDLVNLDLNKRYAIDFQLYLIKSLEIEINNSGSIITAPADVELWKLPYNFGEPFDYATEDYHIEDYN